MDNPYQAPQSNVDNGIIEPKSKRGWKIFFWVMLVLQVISTPLLWVESSPEIYELVSTFIVYPLILLALFGYAYNKKFLSQMVWKVVLVIGLFNDAYAFWELAASGEEFGSDVELYIALGVSAVIFLPVMFFQYLGLYRYSYNAPEVWGKSTDL